MLKRINQKNKTHYHWKVKARDVNEKHFGIKTIEYKPKEALILFKAKIEYIYKTLLTRERWSMYKRINDLDLDPKVLQALHHNPNEFSVLLTNVRKVIDKFHWILDCIRPSINKSSNIDVGDNNIQIDDSNIDQVAINIGSLISTQASETIHSSLKSGHGIRNKKNLVLFIDAISQYFHKQDQRMRFKPSKKSIKKELISHRIYLALNRLKKDFI